MKDDRRPPGPPPRKPSKSHPELVLIGEDDVPETERVAVPPPAPVKEPFRLLIGKPVPKMPTMAELGASVGSLQTAIGHIGASVMETFELQRKLGRQHDGLAQAVNMRFDLFHEELAILRHTLVENHEPRIKDVEEATMSQRAARAARVGGVAIARGSVSGVLFLVALKVIAARWPWLAQLLDGITP